jgi:hypothetical protein
VNNDWKRVGKKWSWPNLKYYPEHLPGGTEENHETRSQGNRSVGLNFNLSPPEYEAGMLATTFGYNKVPEIWLQYHGYATVVFELHCCCVAFCVWRHIERVKIADVSDKRFGVKTQVSSKTLPQVDVKCLYYLSGCEIPKNHSSEWSWSFSRFSIHFACS